MKNRLHSLLPHLCVLLFLCFANFSFAQKGIQIPDFHGKEIKGAAKSQLEQHFEKYEVFQIPTKALSRSVQGKSTTQFELHLGKDRNWKMTLFESNLYGENYTTRVMTENGVETIPRAENAVFKGFLNDNRDNEIRLTIAEGFIFGYVTEGEKTYYIEPLKHHNKMANTDHFVVYTPEDVIPIADAKCGVKDVDRLEENLENIHKSADLACLEMELAQAADYGMFLKYGSVANLNLYMDGIMNAAAANYDNEFLEQIIILISERYIVACSGCDPWLSTGNFNFLLPDFQSWALSSNGFTAPHDLRCLWTTRNIGDGDSFTAVGVANTIGGVCLDNGNTIFEDYSSVFSNMRVVAAHELGHLFGCFHNYEFGSACDGNPGRGVFIMDPMVTSATTWSSGSEPCTLPGGSIGAVNNHVATRPCMSACAGAVCENTFVDGVDIGNTSGATIDMIWNVSSASYQVRARPYGTSTWTYTNTTTTTNDLVTGLMCDTEYEVQVRADCGGGLYGPPTTVSVRTDGLSVDDLNIINCGGGVYDLEVVVDTDNAAAGGSFIIILDGNVFPQTYDGMNPQTIVFPDLATTGANDVVVIVADSNCSQTITYDVPPLACFCTVIQGENFDACTLPAGWTNNALGTPDADWDFGNAAGGDNTPAGNFDGTCMAYWDDDIYGDIGGQAMELISPPVDLTTFQNIDLEFDYNFWVEYGSVFRVDVFDGINWVNVLTETSNACGPWTGCTPPHAIIPVDAYINQNFQVRFTFDDLGNWEWITAMDNFSICGFPADCFAIDPIFLLCNGEESNYDLTQQDLLVNPSGEDVTWFDGQPSAGTATDLSPATAVDLTMVNDLWALVSPSDTCSAETQINYIISPQLTITSTFDTLCTGGSADICVQANLPATAINWTDDTGNTLGTTDCISVTPSATTTYTVAYTDSQGCMGTAQTTIILSTTGLMPDSLDVKICEVEGLMSFDLTQYDVNFGGGTVGTPTANVDWYDGQPSTGGADITSTANATDLTGMPGIWALITDLITNCTQEILLDYEVDTAPQITCPADIVVSSDPDTCGAFVALPLAIVMDDSLTVSTVSTQTIQLDFSGDQLLTFNFNATNIDPTQPVTGVIEVVGNLSTASVNFSDESSFLGSLFAADCTPNGGTLNYVPSQIAPMLANGVFTMIADVVGTSTATCPDNYVSITINYTPLAPDFYFDLTNDYNSGGADASGFYLPGTTIVTYTATDACGNQGTCSVNVTVNQDFIQGEDYFFTACGEFMDFDLTQLSTDFGGGMGTPTDLNWYDGQPSMGGANITANSDSVDLTTMPDIWVQITDPVTGCPTEVNLLYELDAPPQISCPADISVNSDPDTCGAFVMIPIPSVMDDSITAFPDDQTIFVNYPFSGATLQFDFDGANIDQTQPVTLTIIVSGDIGLTSEFYDIFDENGNPFAVIGNGGSGDCTSETATFIIPIADLAAYLADNVMTFTATGTSQVNVLCGLDGVEMSLSYTPLSVQYLTISNDYNSGGEDASGFYLPGTTVVTYIATDGCGNQDSCSINVTVNQDFIQGNDFPFTACGEFMSFDLTQFNTDFGSDMGINLSWYDGQPSMGGANITANADSVDLTSTPDIWILLTDPLTGCPTEVNLPYQLDTPPQVTCPADINVNSDMGICGANVTIPPLVVMDDNITAFPDGQAIFVDYTVEGATLQFDFDGTNIDQTQAATLTITVSGDIGLSSEYYDIFDENGNFYAQLGNGGSGDCTSETTTFTIPIVDLVAYLADNVMTFTATGTTAVNVLCGLDGVEMSLSYTPLAAQYLTISNDYTSGGEDASGFYPAGTTTVTYTVTDGCDNTASCSVDVTVNPGTTTGFFDIITNADTLCTGGAAELCLDIPAGAASGLYAMDLTNGFFSDIALYDIDPATNMIMPNDTFVGADIGATTVALDLNPADNIIYLMTLLNGNNSVRHLYTFDLTAGILSDLGQVISSTGNVRPQDMAFNAAGDLYAVFSGGELHQIDYTASPVTTTFVTTVPSNGGVGLTYNFDNNTLLYTTGQNPTIELFEINYATGASNLLMTFSTPSNGSGCTSQGLEYVGNGLAYSTSTLGCNEIYLIDINASAVSPLLSPTGTYNRIKDLLYIPSFSDENIVWVDDTGAQIDTTRCITVMPNMTTTYTATYTLPNGCVDVSDITIATTGTNLAATTFGVGICEAEDITAFDLTQYDSDITTGTSETVEWYTSQPSMGGTDISTTADSTDLTTMPDIWALITNSITNCTQEVDLIYEIDNSPTITCPADITVNNDPDTCGAFVSIPLASAIDDNVNPLPDILTIRQDYFNDDQPLLFDFAGTNIDINQPITVTVIAVGDLDSSTEYYEIFDENGTSLILLNGTTNCTENIFTYTIPVSDVAAFLADNIISFSAAPTTGVDLLCVDNYVEIQLAYSSLMPQSTSISNDYNSGGADASGFYLPGTTTVTYVAFDGCGNTDTCTVDITVIQEITQEPDLSVIACGDFMNFDLTQLDFNFGGEPTMGTPTTSSSINIDWYNGQPSMSGVNITDMADSTDISGMPDIWALLTDTITGCPSEVNLVYEFDFPPMITCPAEVIVNADAGVCGANVTIPIVTATDDGVSPIPLGQTIYTEFFVSGPTLQFDFSTVNIDLTQAAMLTVTAFADMGDGGETFDIFDESGNLVLQLGNNVFSDCQPETGTITISAADLALFAADNIITFTAIGASNVDPFCAPDAVEMVLDYIPFAPQVTIITNDYNGAGANASDFYPSGTTMVTYTATDGCGNIDTCTVAVTVIQPPITGAPFNAIICGDAAATDLTQLNADLINNTGDVIFWFDGQPSAGGVDITAMAAAADLTGTPDLWVQIVDELTDCIEERDIIYQLDMSPVVTCPTNITVSADAGICGANVTIPAAMVMDDNVTPLPDDQTFFVEHTFDNQVMQFDFDGTNIDQTQPATLTITVSGDIGLGSEYFDIFDENGNFYTQLGNGGSGDCTSETTTFTIPVADLTAFLADNIMTFTATATTSVDFICDLGGVEMNLSYTSLTVQFTTISNDYNNGGAGASDFYPSGTTTVTFSAIDGCGNIGTCSVDITVDQVPIPVTVEADMDTICLGQSVELCLPDVTFGTGQLLGLNTNGTWIGGAFTVSPDLSTVSDDPNFVVPPIQSPAPLSGTYYALDYNPVDGLYYLLANNPTGGVNLYSVDITTGVTIDLGFISDNSILYALGMTFDNSGNLYLAIVTTAVSPFVTNIEVIPAGMLTSPVPTPTFLGAVPWLSGSLTGMTYNFDDNTLYYSTGSTELYELDLSGNIINGPVNYFSPVGCTGQSIEYAGNGILLGGACNQIYPIDPITGSTGPVLATHSGDFSDLLFVPSTEVTWTDDSGNIVSTGTENCINVMPEQTTTYTASYVSDDCIYEGSTTVTVLDLNMNDAVTITDPGSTCVAGQLLDFTGSPDGGVFTSTATAGFASDGINSATLNPAEAGVGVYDITYTYTNDIGCVGHATVTVEIYDEPVIMVSSNSPVCADESLQLVETGGMAVAWSWTSDGTATFNDATAQSPSASGVSDGETFTVNITDINGCTATSSLSANILPLPEANDPQLLFCPNEDISSVDLLVENTNVNPNATPTSVTWYDGNPDDGGTLISPADNVNLNNVVDLWALATDDNGCSSPVNVGIFFYPGMTFAPTIEVPTCADDDSGVITLNISGGLAPYSHTWTSEDGTGSGTGDLVTDLTIGAYNIVVTDANGCSETTSVEIAEESCFFTITNSFLASDPCRCNGDQTENGAGDGTFTEVVTVVGAPGLIIRAGANSTGLSTGSPVDFYENFPGRYRLDFTHLDRVGYVIYVEFSEDGGQTFNPATDDNGMQLVISNVCAYPVLGFIPELTEFCEIEPEFTIDAQEISPDVDFIDLPGFPAIAINNGFQIPAPITFDPAGLGGSTYTFTAYYNHQSGTGTGGTLAAPAIALNVCPTFIRVNVPINDEPEGEAVCGPGAQANEAIIEVSPMEDYPTVENLMYRIDNGPFQVSNQFAVNESETYDITIMDMETACSYEFEVACVVVLPIELTGFEAMCDDNEYVLEWKTATEENVLEFVVERSTNGTDFTELGKVTAVGNSTTTQIYTYRDETAQTGRYYYRLRIIEADGKVTLSRIEAVSCLKGVFDIVDVFPNPTDEQLTILFETINTDVINFKLTDVLGRTIMEENITPDIGLNSKVIDLSQLASAVYFVVMNDGKAVRKVVRK